MREENSNEYNVLEQGFTDQVFFLFLKHERERERERERFVGLRTN